MIRCSFFLILLFVVSCVGSNVPYKLDYEFHNSDDKTVLDFRIEPSSVGSFNIAQIRNDLHSVYSFSAVITFHTKNRAKTEKFEITRQYSYNPWDKFYSIKDSFLPQTDNFDDIGEFAEAFFDFKNVPLPTEFSGETVYVDYELRNENFPVIFVIFDKNICNIEINNLKCKP